MDENDDSRLNIADTRLLVSDSLHCNADSSSSYTPQKAHKKKPKLIGFDFFNIKQKSLIATYTFVHIDRRAGLIRHAFRFQRFHRDLTLESCLRF